MKKVLIVIDYQNDFVNGSLGFSGAEKLDSYIANMVKEYGPGRVRYTQDTHDENYLNTREGKKLPIVHCIKNSEGWELYGETAKALKEVNALGVCKKSFGMNNDEIAKLNIPEDVTEIKLVGLVSYICVISNAAVLQAKYPEATIVVDKNGILGPDKNANEMAIKIMEAFQVNIV